MSIQIDIMLAILSAGVAAGTFFLGRLSAARTSGSEWGSLKADIGHIMRDVAEVKEDVRRLDARLDDHVQQHIAL